MITVFAIGVFDLFHRGYIEFLKAAKSLGDQLTIYKEEDRPEMVSSCKYVNHSN
ncbi:MAG: adenylyltransferase/cytidyltransferase family protein [Balneolaceae bacterium]